MTETVHRAAFWVPRDADDSPDSIVIINNPSLGSVMQAAPDVVHRAAFWVPSGGYDTPTQIRIPKNLALQNSAAPAASPFHNNQQGYWYSDDTSAWQACRGYNPNIFTVAAPTAQTVHRAAFWVPRPYDEATAGYLGPYKNLALQNGTPVIPPTTLDSPSFLSAMENFGRMGSFGAR